MIDFIEYLFLIFQVFTWHGATIELEGKKELAYVAEIQKLHDTGEILKFTVPLYAMYAEL